MTLAVAEALNPNKPKPNLNFTFYIDLRMVLPGYYCSFSIGGASVVPLLPQAREKAPPTDKCPKLVLGPLLLMPGPGCDDPQMEQT